jgi:hypothetical protein
MKKQIDGIIKILKTSGAVSYEPNVYRLPSEELAYKFYVAETDGRLTIDYSIFAKALYNAGYRRQEGVAKEIFAEIEREIETLLEKNYIVYEKYLNEQDNPTIQRVDGKIDALRGIYCFIEDLKKKYGGQEDEQAD